MLYPKKKKRCKYLIYNALHFLSADRTGLEPATSAVTGRHSNRLNYRSNTFFRTTGLTDKLAVIQPLKHSTTPCFVCLGVQK